MLIGMAWRIEQRMLVSQFDYTAEIHHRDAVGDVLHDAEIVRNEEQRNTALALLVLE